MKKIFIKPETSVQDVHAVAVIAVSLTGGSIGQDDDTAESRMDFNIWEEDM